MIEKIEVKKSWYNDGVTTLFGMKINELVDAVNEMQKNGDCGICSGNGEISDDGLITPCPACNAKSTKETQAQSFHVKRDDTANQTIQNFTSHLNLIGIQVNTQYYNDIECIVSVVRQKT